MPFKKPCRVCEEKFQPTGRTNFLCQKCRDNSRKERWKNYVPKLRKKYPYYYKYVDKSIKEKEKENDNW